MSPETILLLSANPMDTGRLQLGKECEKIKDGLKLSKHRDHFTVEPHQATQAMAMRRALLDHTPSIVHFSGHGIDSAGIVLEDDTGNSHLVDAEALASLFKLFSLEVRCVVLNACYSEAQANAIAEHIDYVIGMSQEISDAASIVFAVAFYDALGAGRTIEFAFDFGCTAIQMEGIPEHLTPVLKKRQMTEAESGNSKHTFIAPTDVQELKILINNLPIDADEFHNLFDDVFNKIETKQYLVRPNCAPNDKTGLIDFWVDTAELLDANIPVPLLEFIWRLHDKTQHAALQVWLDKAINDYPSAPDRVKAIRDNLGQTKDLEVSATEVPPYLMLILNQNTPGSTEYSLKVILQDHTGRQNVRETIDSDFKLSAMPEMMERLLTNDPEVIPAIKHGLTLEFFLPFELLNENIDNWAATIEKPLTARLRLAVRSEDRLRREFTDRWEEAWRKNQLHLNQPPGEQCSLWLDTPEDYDNWLDNVEDGHITEITRGGKCLFILRFIPDNEFLGYFLDEGGAILLWPQTVLTDKLAAQFESVIFKERRNEGKIYRPPILAKLTNTIAQIRRALGRKNRRGASKATFQPGDLSLLWDDPERGPKQRLPASVYQRDAPI